MIEDQSATKRVTTHGFRHYNAASMTFLTTSTLLCLRLRDSPKFLFGCYLIFGDLLEQVNDSVEFLQRT